MPLIHAEAAGAPRLPASRRGEEGGAADEGASGRSRLLAATVERERLEGVLRLLPRALAGASPRRVAEVLVDGACLVTNARVAWALLFDAVPVISGRCSTCAR